MLRVGIVANEPSGDLLGAGLISEIRRRVPDAVFEGVGGPLMIEQGCRSLFPMERLSVMGLVEVLRHLPELFSIRRKLLDHFIANPPDIFIGVDAPDFNLGLETSLKASGIPTVHYVSPSVWAWRPKRVEKIRAAVDLVLGIFPFEVEFLQRHQVPVTFVGHPLADEIPLENDPGQARQRLGMGKTGRVIALLPGSRMSEVAALAGPFIEAAQLCHRKYPDLGFVVPTVNRKTREAFGAVLRETAPDLPVRILDGQARDAMLVAEAVLTASGTATLEGLLLKRPMVVAYRLNRLTYWIVKRFNMIKIPYVAMANLLADEPLAPEFIQEEATPAALASALEEFLEDREKVKSIQEKYHALHEKLQQNASSSAAEAVLDLIGRREAP
jgi:lipid-A-disaccharide synthase